MNHGGVYDECTGFGQSTFVSSFPSPKGHSISYITFQRICLFHRSGFKCAWVMCKHIKVTKDTKVAP